MIIFLAKIPKNLHARGKPSTDVYRARDPYSLLLRVTRILLDFTRIAMEQGFLKDNHQQLLNSSQAAPKSPQGLLKAAQKLEHWRGRENQGPKKTSSLQCTSPKAGALEGRENQGPKKQLNNRKMSSSMSKMSKISEILYQL